MGAAPLRVLDDSDRRQADRLPRARARGAAADLRAAAAQERQRHHAVVRAGEAVGVARGRARRFPDTEARGVGAARAKRRSAAGGGAARQRLAPRRRAQGSARSVQEEKSSRARVVGEGSRNAARSRQAGLRGEAVGRQASRPGAWRSTVEQEARRATRPPELVRSRTERRRVAQYVLRPATWRSSVEQEARWAACPPELVGSRTERRRVARSTLRPAARRSAARQAIGSIGLATRAKTLAGQTGGQRPAKRSAVADQANGTARAAEAVGRQAWSSG